MRWTGFLTSAVALALAGMAAAAPPNILWIISDDHGPDLGCYGTPAAYSPRLDALAAAGTRYTQAHMTAPICSPSRTALMTGMYQTTIGGHHHRSNRDVPLPAPVVPVTKLFRDAGWFVANDDGSGNPGKTDLNFQHEPLFDGVSWRERAPGQPFFAQVNLFQPHRPFVTALHEPTDPAAVVLPPYLPDDPELRADWANYLDSIRLLDVRVGQVLDRLREDGLEDSTVVFFFGDNGRPHPRDKQFLYSGGTGVPLIIRGPGFEAGAVSDQLVSGIDLTAQTLAIAGLPVPEWMQGRPFHGPGAVPREFLFSARDRADETVDRIRAVRTADWLYIRNFMPDRPWLQQNLYKEAFYPGWRMLRAEAAAGGPPRVSFLAPARPIEELYDRRADPHEMTNLVADPKHAAVLARLRGALETWIRETGDRGAIPEDPAIAEQLAREAEAAAAADPNPPWGPARALPWQNGAGQ
jgi:uncharacterized sulfatase